MFAEEGEYSDVGSDSVSLFMSLFAEQDARERKRGGMNGKVGGEVVRGKRMGRRGAEWSEPLWLVS